MASETSFGEVIAVGYHLVIKCNGEEEFKIPYVH